MMFEAIVTLCLDLAAGPCRDQLLPGYEAPALADCEATLAARPPVLPDRLLVRGEVRCAPSGAALAVEEVATGVFVHQGRIEIADTHNLGDVANIGFVIGSTSVAVIDTGSARWLGESLWRSIRARTSLPVSHVVLTHMHPDHVLGTAPFVETGAAVVAHAGLPRALADRAETYRDSTAAQIGDSAFIGSEFPAVTVEIEDQGVIDLGGRVLALKAWPAAHTGADLTAVDSASGILFAGDLVFHRHAPSLDGSLTGWRKVIGELAAQDLSGVVPGHGDVLLGWPDGLGDLSRYLATLEADTRAALDRGDRLGDVTDSVAASESGRWSLFDVHNPHNATAAYTELEWE